MSAIVAIDLGTSAVKVGLFRPDGTLLGEARRPWTTARPEPGAAEQDPATWWSETRLAVMDAIRQGGASPRDVAVIAVTGQMHGTVLTDDRFDPLAPAIIWADQRSAADAATLTGAVGPERVIAITGGPLAPGFQASTLAWLRRTRPRLLAGVRHTLLPKDWLVARLSGAAMADPSDAAGTGLFDVRERAWSPEMLAAAGVAGEFLPPVAPSGTRSGRLTSSAAAALGLQSGLPVVTGAGDAAAAALGAGVTRPGDLLLTVSTGSQLWSPISRVPDVPGGQLQTFLTTISPDDGAGLARVAATLNTGSAVDWAASALGFADAATFLRAATAEPARPDDPLFIPYLAGERSPWFDPGAAGAFVGITGRHTRIDLARGVVEGVTLAIALAWEPLHAEVGAPEQVLLTGGGTQSPGWRQLIADSLGLPVAWRDDANQTLRGAAILATASLTGERPATVAAAWTAPVRMLTPNPARIECLAARRDRLRRAYLALRAI